MNTQRLSRVIGRALLGPKTGYGLALLVLMTSCTTFDPQAGFPEMSDAVKTRSGMQVAWNAGTALDAQVDQKVRALLANELTVDAVVQVALLNNRDLQATYAELGVAQADLVQAGLLKNPVFDIGVQFPLSGGMAKLDLLTAIDFLDILYMPLRKRVAAARFEDAKLQVTGTVLDFAARVRAAFYRHQANEQMLELLQIITQGLTISLEVAQRLHEAGNITDLDLARERALTEEAKLQLGATELAVRQSREQLNILMGLWGNATAWAINKRLPDIPDQPLPSEGLVSQALRQSLELASARQRILVAGEQLGITKATALLPELSLAAIAEREGGDEGAGLKATCWAYNNHVNSTVIEAVEGERIRIYVTNRLEVPTSVHWHGLYLPNGMDGVSGLTQPNIKPGETFKYEWTLRQYGTFMYHSHHDTMTQEGMGLIGMFVIHPRKPKPAYHVDRDFAIMLAEWAIEPGTSRPNTLEMSDFNILTMNGKCFPSTDALVCKTGDRVRIRLGNLSQMDHHPIHLHGYHFRITATDSEDIPLSAQWPETSVLVAVGQTRNIEFIADAPGDWAMHCHMTHHIMNQMGHEFPNMVGMKPGDLDARVQSLLPGYMTMGHTGMAMGRMAEVMPMPANSIPMKGKLGPFGDYMTSGGMFTLLKVRDHVKRYDQDPGWYQHPPGTVALKASARDLARDGIDVNAQTASAADGELNATTPRLARVDPIPPAMRAHLARWGRRAK